METEQKEVLELRESLVEMYKAGFLDGYSQWIKLKNKKDWNVMNENYKKSFIKRFETKVTKELKKMEKKKKCT